MKSRFILLFTLANVSVLAQRGIDGCWCGYDRLLNSETCLIVNHKFILIIDGDTTDQVARRYHYRFVADSVIHIRGENYNSQFSMPNGNLKFKLRDYYDPNNEGVLTLHGVALYRRCSLEAVPIGFRKRAQRLLR